jgi:hypothetical protein
LQINISIKVLGSERWLPLKNAFIRLINARGLMGFVVICPHIKSPLLQNILHCGRSDKVSTLVHFPQSLSRFDAIKFGHQRYQDDEFVQIFRYLNGRLTVVSGSNVVIFLL